MPAFSHYFQRCFALVTTSIVVGAGLSRPFISLDSSSDRDQDDNDDSYTKTTMDTFKKWFYWSRLEHASEHQEIEPSKENMDHCINELRLREEYQTPKYPVVLCHGLSGFDKLMVVPSFTYLLGLSRNTGTSRRDFVVVDHDGVALEYWFGIKEALEAKGTKVLVARVPGFGSIEERSQKLNHFISREVEMLLDESVDEVYNEKNQSKTTFQESDKKMKVNLIAHSMGGLDSRYLISELEKQNYEIVSLTTVSTPHRGSEMADFVVDLAEKFPQKVTLPPSFNQLTTEYLKGFNERVKDDPNVHYFSYGAEFKPAWYNVFYASWSIINSKAGDNDGMVSVESSKWGTYLGTLMNVDHLDLINWTNAIKRAVGVITPGSNGPEIDSVALYLDIADNLAKRGL